MSDATSQDRAVGPRYQPLMIVLAAVCAGVVLDRTIGTPIPFSITTACGAWGGWLMLRRRGRDRWASVALLLSVAACGAAWHHAKWNVFGHNDLGWYTQAAPQPVCVEAVAVSQPRRIPAPPYDPMQIIPRGDTTRVELRVTAIRDRGRWLAASGRTLLTVDGHLLGVYAGDRLRVFGQLSAPRGPMNPGEFDYAGYLRGERKLSLLRMSYPDCVTVTRRSPPTNPRRWLGAARSSGRELLQRHLDDRRQALAAAILLGAREGVTAEQSQRFMETGTVHILAISGLHVGIVVFGLFFLLRTTSVSRRRAALIVAAVAIFYTLLTDARPPAVRATILVLVVCASHWTNRPPLAFNSLAAAGLIVLFLSPASLFNTGVQLSFLAVAGLMWFAPGWFDSTSDTASLKRTALRQRAWPWRFTWLAWRWALQLTLVGATIWILALPLVMARFHLLTLVAIGINTLLWVPVAVALACGFGVLATGWLLPPAAHLCGRLMNGSLWLVETLIDTAHEIPYGHLWVPGPADWWLAGFYGGLAMAAAFPALRPRRRWQVGLLAAWIIVGFLFGANGPLANSPRRQRLDCTFLAVGHGAAVVLELPSGATILCDAGKLSSPDSGARSISAYLWSRGITRIDALLLTHGDADHYNAVPDLLERFAVGAIYVSPVMFEKENQAMTALRQAIDESGVPLRVVYSNDRLTADDDVRIEVLHPPRRGRLGSDNANSIVLAVEYQGRRILLPGDLESPGLDDLLDEEPWDCDVLLAPHHGSRNSNPPGLAAWCEPEWLIVSGNLDRTRSDPMDAYRQSDAEVLYTGEFGAVRARIDARGLTIEPFVRP